MNIKIPPDATLISQATVPLSGDLRVGTLWNPTGTDKLYRLELGETCPTCKRPGREKWIEVPEGMESLRDEETL